MVRWIQPGTPSSDAGPRLQSLIAQRARRFSLSPRRVRRAGRIARTIADLAGVDHRPARARGRGARLSAGRACRGSGVVIGVGNAARIRGDRPGRRGCAGFPGTRVRGGSPGRNASRGSRSPRYPASGRPDSRRCSVPSAARAWRLTVLTSRSLPSCLAPTRRRAAALPASAGSAPKRLRPGSKARPSAAAARVVTAQDRDYPARLRRLALHPPVLYVAGRVDRLEAGCVAVVGTRRPTGYGRAAAAEIADELARAGICVISGLALGIDGIAHRAAIEAGGATAAVLPSPIDRIYPPRHRALAAAIIAADGVLLSESPPGRTTGKPDFARRNRIVSGLADAVVIVEAPDRSGALLTAAAAADQGRDLMAVPGPIDSIASRGCNRLIADHQAEIVTSAVALVQRLGLRPAGQVPARGGALRAGGPRPWVALPKERLNRGADEPDEARNLRPCERPDAPRGARFGDQLRGCHLPSHAWPRSAQGWADDACRSRATRRDGDGRLYCARHPRRP